MLIYQLERGVTADYVTDELLKYLKAMCGLEATVKYEKEPEEGLILATFQNLGIPATDIEDPEIDDAYAVSVKGLRGYISGSNVRSILYGVYAYLYAAGCRFLRPGEDGEFIPQRDMREFICECRKKADCRYRCHCIEGSLSYEMIDEHLKWMLKAGYNGYMIQGTSPTFMLDRWYSHLGNKYKKGKPLTWEEESGLTRIVEKNIKKYGLLFHDVGHDYLFPAYGIYRDRDLKRIDEPLKSHIALVNGERKIIKALKYTNLCYSNPEVRKRIADYFVKYLTEKPEVDYLHVWLADDKNNACQCKSCASHTVSDLYVMLLNEIDKALTENHIDTKIVFILYNDTMIPPQKETFINPKRFVMMTAVMRWQEDNILGYAADASDANHKSEAFIPIMQHQNDWREIFDGDIFFYDYHLYSEHFDDIGHDLITKRLVRDVKHLSKHHSKGLMNCATSRLNMPTSLPAFACGLALFDQSMDLEQLKEDYFISAFGADGMKVKTYLETLSTLFLPDLLSYFGVSAADQEFTEPNVKVKLKWMHNPEANKSFRQIKGALDAFWPVLEGNLDLGEACHRKSWELLKLHHTQCRMLAEALVLGSGGNVNAAQEKVRELIHYLAFHEDEYALHFEYFLYAKRLRFTFGITGSIWAELN